MYIKRDKAVGGGFSVLDELGREKYIIPADPRHSLKLNVCSLEGNCLSVIKYNKMMFDYFTVRCGRMYALVPFVRENFAFAIYGSTCRFSGDLALGNFYLTDSLGDILMKQSRCISPPGEISCICEGWELDFVPEDLSVYGANFEIFALSSAICADMYITSSTESRGVVLGY